MLIQSSEDFGKILAQTLNNDTKKILEAQENIGINYFPFKYVFTYMYYVYIAIVVIKTELTTQESINEGMSVSFPDDSDDLTMFAGQTTRIELPNELLRLALHNLSGIVNFLILIAKMFTYVQILLQFLL